MDTSLHIALVDSDPGDRKQMERLLERESDKRKDTTGNFYIDTFGGIEAILKAPLVYDVYFIDSTDPRCDSDLIAHAVRGKGIITPIIYCISTVDFRNNGVQKTENCFFMDKPIKTEELSNMLDEIIRKKKEEYVPTIELRSNYEAYYVVEPDIMYFETNGGYINVHMKSGSVRQATIYLDNMWRDLYAYPTFQKISKSAIVNTRYVSEIGMFSVTMQDGAKLKTKKAYRQLIKDKVARYKEQ